MDNIVFLDIDGCIRTGIGDEESGTSHLVVFDRKFCVKSVSALNYISNVTRCKFVISSTWRTHYKIEDLREIFRKNGLYIDVIGYTEVLGEGRGEEIQEYLDTHDVNKYVVIDDTVSDILKFISPKRVVKCEPNIGLRDESKVDEILDLLV